jgi:hypothetical protein
MYRHTHDENDHEANTHLASPHAKENAPPVGEWRSESLKGKTLLQGKLDTLNIELRYSGVPELRVCLCDSGSFDSLADVYPYDHPASADYLPTTPDCGSETSNYSRKATSSVPPGS